IPEEMAESPDVGFLLFAPPEKPVAGPCEILSPQGNIAEAAIHLYAALRRLDALDLRLLIALPLPERGIGIAINDRLKKAAHGAG
ncbi:MAG: Sua5 family C-terminal domain-containing protein, partial [Candidatus Sumerlaeota bacterium]